MPVRESGRRRRNAGEGDKHRRSRSTNLLKSELLRQKNTFHHQIYLIFHFSLWPAHLSPSGSLQSSIYLADGGCPRTECWGDGPHEASGSLAGKRWCSRSNGAFSSFLRCHISTGKCGARSNEHSWHTTLAARNRKWVKSLVNKSGPYVWACWRHLVAHIHLTSLTRPLT